ncbi:U3 small nucleolar ribonucleoprotein protein IMP3-like [Cyprinus carpio]|uniref:U3 small nucleolar ribonucleoprotein protein IMP3-like n=1 Tax=Cyprinus carpio TaxID=7962 RepID=A0A9Q9W1R7_CYPCA|nr:U3 small nucleolar ribonucleoprotein protein IMP3-like [Cyprinus carpio]
MVLKLKFHKQKLLKEVDFINWEVDNNLHEVKMLRKYHIEKREDYTTKKSRNIRELAQKIWDFDEKDGFRAQSTALFLEKLYSVGLIPTKQKLSLTNEVSASAFCRRRLPTIMLKLRMAQNLKTAITFIEQGYVQSGPPVIVQYSYRSLEDFVTWVDSSKIKQHVMNYNEERDDFDLIV